MELYIQIRNGMPWEHPILKENLLQAFPNLDLENLPDVFAKFQRLPVPAVASYEVYTGVTYEWDNGIVKDVHHVRPMTEDEKDSYIRHQLANQPFPSWNFNRDTGHWEAPTPMPEGGPWLWNEPTLSWVAPPTR